MKHVMLLIIITVQLIFSSVTLAWSPLEIYQEFNGSRRSCYSVIATSEEEELLKKKELEAEGDEEEEPECD